MSILSYVNTSGSVGMSAEEFAKKYMVGVNIEEYLKKLRRSEVLDFVKFFELARRGLSLSGRVGSGVDRGGREYKFYTFIRAKGPDGCKIIPIGDWENVIEDYLDGNLRINFNADDLFTAILNP